MTCRNHECRLLGLQFAEMCARSYPHGDSNNVYSYFLQTARNRLKELSRELPPRMVLINTSPGSFYLSDAFYAFMRDEVHRGHLLKLDDEFHEKKRVSRSAEGDVDLILAISRFGKHVARRYPSLYETILLHMTSCLDDKIDTVRLEMEDGDGEMPYTSDPLGLRISEHLEHNSERSFVPNSDKEFMEDCAIYGESDPRTWQSKARAYMSLDAVDVLHDNACRTKLRTFYDDDLSSAQSQASAGEDACLLLGLIAASGKSSTLRVRKIPALCGHAVKRHHDGSESVQIT